MTETTTNERSTSPTEDAVTRYLNFWNSTPAEQRRTADTFTPDSSYVAPVGVLTGVDGLADFTQQFIDNMGGYQFRARTEPDVHHQHARLAWELRVGDTSFAEGTDVLTVDDDGMISTVVTFVDRAPEGHPHHEE